MLDAFIIDELRRREEADKNDCERPRLELPIDREDRAPSNPGHNRKEDEEDDEDGSDRGVVIIDLSG